MALLRIEVAYSPSAGQVDLVEVELPGGATVADALATSGLLQRHAIDPAAAGVGVWGRVRAPTQPLCDGDRVEIYRSLAVDPKVARRLRHQRQRAAAKRSLATGS